MRILSEIRSLARNAIALGLLLGGVLVLAACADYLVGLGDGGEAARSVRGIHLDRTEVAVDDGAATELHATLMDQKGEPFEAAPEGVEIRWGSSDTLVLSVVSTGPLSARVQAVHPGSAAITAVAEVPGGEATIEVSVEVRRVPTGIEGVSGEGQVGEVGTALPEPLLVRVFDRHNEGVADVPVVFSADAEGAGFDTDTVRTDTLGVASNAWTLGGRAGEQTATAATPVLAEAWVPFAATAAPGPIDTIAISPAVDTLPSIGDTLRYEAAPRDRFGNPLQVDIEWSSSDPDVAGVDTTGLATAMGPGTAFITAAVDTVVSRAELVVARAVGPGDPYEENDGLGTAWDINAPTDPVLDAYDGEAGLPFRTIADPERGTASLDPVTDMDYFSFGLGELDRRVGVRADNLTSTGGLLVNLYDSASGERRLRPLRLVSSSGTGFAQLAGLRSYAVAVSAQDDSVPAPTDYRLEVTDRQADGSFLSIGSLDYLNGNMDQSLEPNDFSVFPGALYPADAGASYDVMGSLGLGDVSHDVDLYAVGAAAGSAVTVYARNNHSTADGLLVGIYERGSDGQLAIQTSTAIPAGTTDTLSHAIGSSNPHFVGIYSPTGTAGSAYDLCVTTSTESCRAQLLWASGGNNQVGAPGQTLLEPLSVTVANRFEQPVSGVRVRFTTSAGTLSDEYGVTNALGMAQTTLTLPADTGTIHVAAEVLGAGTYTFTATSREITKTEACSGSGTSHGGTLATDATWAKADNPHTLTSNVYVDNAALTVEAGAVVCGAPGATLTFQNGARLQARGTTTDTILFTELYPDSTWGGIQLTGAPADTSYITDAVVEHTDAFWGAIQGEETHPVVMDGTTVRQSRQAGVRLLAPGSRISRSRIHTTGTEGVWAGDSVTVENTTVTGAGSTGVYVRGYGARLRSVRIEGSGAVGLEVEYDAWNSWYGSLAEATGVRITGGATHPLQVPISAFALLAPMPADQDSLLGNAVDEIVIQGGDLNFAELTSDTVTVRSDIPWQVLESFTVGSGALLKVEPGARVALAGGTSIDFDSGGLLDARGTTTETIVFTSTSGAGGRGGSWASLNLDGAPEDTSYITNARIEYGGRYRDGAVAGGWSHPVVVDSTTIRQSYHRAIELGNSSSRIVRSRIDTTAVPDYSAVYLRGATMEDATVIGSADAGVGFTSATLRNVLIEGSGAIGLFGSDRGTMTGGTGVRVTGGASYPARIPIDAFARIAPTPAAQDSAFGGNASDTLIINGGTLVGDTLRIGPNWGWQVSRAPIIDYSGGFLEIEPGTNVAMWSSGGIIVSAGQMVARGTPTNPIVFTATDPASPWGTISFSGNPGAGVTSYITNARVEYGGASAGTTYPAAIAATSSHPLVVDSTVIRQSATRALRLLSGNARVVRSQVDTTLDATYAAVEIGWSAQLDSTTIRGAAGHGIEINGDDASISYCDIRGSGGSGIFAEGYHTGVTANNCNLVGNTGYGVENLMSSFIDATYNYWGDSTGPTGTNGDGVHGNVDVEPYRESEAW